MWLVDRFGPRAPYIVHAEIMEQRRKLADEEIIAALLTLDRVMSEWVKPRVADAIH
ncbi:MAG: hypothetical protein ACLQJR_20670 [Stellaceae bacterium]